MFWKKLLQLMRPRGVRRWDLSYREGDIPWDSGEVSPEMVNIIEVHRVKPGKVLELGCGTGTNSVYLARNGFSVTAIDISGVALEMAREKAREAGVNIRFIEAKLPDVSLASHEISEGSFDFIFDRGCFHTISADQRDRYAKLVFRLLKKGGHYLVLTGNAREPRHPGPPVLTEGEIRGVFGKSFDVIQIRDFRFKAKGSAAGALGHSCFMKKR